MVISIRFFIFVICVRHKAVYTIVNAFGSEAVWKLYTYFQLVVSVFIYLIVSIFINLLIKYTSQKHTQWSCTLSDTDVYKWISRYAIKSPHTFKFQSYSDTQVQYCKGILFFVICFPILLHTGVPTESNWRGVGQHNPAPLRDVSHKVK